MPIRGFSPGRVWNGRSVKCKMSCEDEDRKEVYYFLLCKINEKVLFVVALKS